MTRITGEMTAMKVIHSDIRPVNELSLEFRSFARAAPQFVEGLAPSRIRPTGGMSGSAYATLGALNLGKRELSMSMVRKLRDRFHVSADLLISPLRRRGLAA